MCADASSGRPALENAQRTKISEYEIRLITAPYFLATKREAFFAGAATATPQPRPGRDRDGR
jgi:hypothetical protein